MYVTHVINSEFFSKISFIIRIILFGQERMHAVSAGQASGSGSGSSLKGSHGGPKQQLQFAGPYKLTETLGK